MNEPFQGFSLTLPACTAREVQLLTPLVEVLLGYGPDRWSGQPQRVVFHDVESYPLAKALEYLAVALAERLLSDFQAHFGDFWQPEDAQAWRAAAATLAIAADEIRDAVTSLTVREADRQPGSGSPSVSAETLSSGGDV